MTKLTLDQLHGRKINIRIGDLKPLLRTQGFEEERKCLHGSMWKEPFTGVTLQMTAHQNDQGYATPGAIDDVLAALKRAIAVREQMTSASSNPPVALELPAHMKDTFAAVQQGSKRLLFYREYPGLKIEVPVAMQAEKALEILSAKHAATLALLRSLKEDYGVTFTHDVTTLRLEQKYPVMDTVLVKTRENFVTELQQVAEQVVVGMQRRVDRLNRLASRDGFDIALTPDPVTDTTVVNLTHLARQDVGMRFCVKGQHGSTDSIQFIPDAAALATIELEHLGLKPLGEREACLARRVARNREAARLRMHRRNGYENGTGDEHGPAKETQVDSIPMPDVTVAGVTVKPQTLGFNENAASDSLRER